MSTPRPRALMAPGACLVTDAVDLATPGRDFRHGHGVRPVAIVAGGRVEIAYLPGPAPAAGRRPAIRLVGDDRANGRANGRVAAQAFEFVMDADGIIRSLRPLGVLADDETSDVEAAE